jgi:superfamily II DNA/RNA helicase
VLPEELHIDVFVVRPQDKPSALFFILERIANQGKVIVFVPTRYHVDYLVALVGITYECSGIFGKMDMEQRTNTLDKFRRGKQRAILIVTDLAARGLDIPSVHCVIHFDYPANQKTFVHRSGRTARKG